MLHKSKIDLDFNTRNESIGFLQISLASSIDLSLQIKQAHWNIKGLQFIGLHKFLDELHEVVNDFVDLIAERITALSGDAEGNLAHVVEKTILSAYPTGINSITDHIEALTDSISTLGEFVRNAIKATDEKDDMGTSDLFTEVSRGLDHNLWLLEAHLQS